MAIRVVLFMVTILSIQGAPPISFDAIIKAAQEAANNGKWDLVQNVLSNKNEGLQGDIGSVRKLTPVSGGHVYGESELTFHSSLDQGGSKVEKSAGHKIINDDGLVKEYDFEPDLKEIERILLEHIANHTKTTATLSPDQHRHLDDGSVRKYDFKVDSPVTPAFRVRAREGRVSEPQSLEDIARTVNGLLATKFQDMFKANFSSVRELKPLKGGHVYGQSDLTIHSASNLDGRNIQHSSGHRLINTDGQVNEFDFKPNEKDLARHFIELSLTMAKLKEKNVPKITEI